jgi:hypothetical protein
MKQLAKGLTLKTLLTLLMIAMFQMLVWAQEEASGSGSSPGSSSTTTTTKSSSVSSQSADWYTSPWVWVIGAAVFILLLVALLRGGSRSGATTATRTDRVTVTKSSSLD